VSRSIDGVSSMETVRLLCVISFCFAVVVFVINRRRSDEAVCRPVSRCSHDRRRPKAVLPTSADTAHHIRRLLSPHQHHQYETSSCCICALCAVGLY